MEELEEKAHGRLSEEDFELLFGERWAKLKAVGVINNALIDGYGQKASADDDSHGLFDEKEQARLILERYDARRAPASIKRRRKGKAAEDGKDHAAKVGLGDASAHGRGEGQGLGSRSTSFDQKQEPDAPTSPYQPDDLERRL
ncbi:hypothetical protein [Bosea massiliensis]|uniref:Uncharacterized protein n=1 Tax=Bosea massiliensis TaxID=151419 RepID=A0ABW0P5M8_9HYPH